MTSVYLQPGDLIATRTPTLVKTILGSCISVCLWDDELAVGGINHYLLPYGSAAADRPSRFGCFAIESLIAAVCEQGARRQHLQAKLFGGASMLAGVTPRAGHIGVQNLKLAVEMLDSAGIPVVGRDVGGERGRKITFQTDDGSVALWDL